MGLRMSTRRSTMGSGGGERWGSCQGDTIWLDVETMNLFYHIFWTVSIRLLLDAPAISSFPGTTLLQSFRNTLRRCWAKWQRRCRGLTASRRFWAVRTRRWYLSTQFVDRSDICCTDEYGRGRRCNPWSSRRSRGWWQGWLCCWYYCIEVVGKWVLKCGNY